MRRCGCERLASTACLAFFKLASQSIKKVLAMASLGAFATYALAQSYLDRVCLSSSSTVAVTTGGGAKSEAAILAEARAAAAAGVRWEGCEGAGWTRLVWGAKHR